MFLPHSSALILLLVVVDGSCGLFQNISELKSSLLKQDVLATEGGSVLLKCNISGDNVQWFHPKGEHLENSQDGKWWIVSGGALNISSVAFSDRGRYTCSSASSNCSVTLRVAYTHSGLGLYYVTVCLAAFSVTMILNAARLCLMNGHVKKTERVINEFFRTEGAEKLQKALEVAKRIPIVTSEKTIELAKVTQFKTMELARHMEDLARSVPLPPLLLNCTMVGEEPGAETGKLKDLDLDKECERESLLNTAEGGGAIVTIEELGKEAV